MSAAVGQFHLHHPPPPPPPPIPSSQLMNPGTSIPMGTMPPMPPMSALQPLVAPQPPPAHMGGLHIKTSPGATPDPVTTPPGGHNPDVLLALLARNKALEATIPRCGGCSELILDRFILKVLERPWHARCLKCHECGCQLSERCFARHGEVFCKEDFFKRFGTKCAGCDQGIPPTQVVRRAQEHVFHLGCFACALCARQLATGDEFYLTEDRRLVCKADWEAARSKGEEHDGSLEGDQPNKRPRTTITAKQLETLKSAYNNSPKPARHVREQLSQDTGLDMRVVQVWFQNRRAKEKRLKKDAGRTRWSQYFRSMKGGAGSSSPRSDKMDATKDSERELLDSSFSHSHDLGSNDSYSTVANMTMEGGESGAPSPRGGAPSFLGAAPSSPSFLGAAGGHSPPPHHGAPPHHIPPGWDHAMFSIGAGRGGAPPPPTSLAAGPGSDLSSASSPHGYPDFPPSPDSWLGEVGSRY